MAMSKWVEGKVVGMRRWNEYLYTLRVDAAMASFEAGQFTKLALDINGERVERAYSIASAPAERPLEFYFIVVPDGLLTKCLAALQPGDSIQVLARAAGFFTLSEVPVADNLWMLSTGTGIAPFLSILKTETPWRRFRQVVLVHAVRTASELSYGDTIRRIAQNQPEQFRFVPFVSREDTAYALRARIPAAIADGRLQARAGIALSAEKSQVMVCGNPGMVRDTTEILLALGMKKHRRRDPGQITAERYW